LQRVEFGHLERRGEALEDAVREFEIGPGDLERRWVAAGGGEHGGDRIVEADGPVEVVAFALAVSEQRPDGVVGHGLDVFGRDGGACEVDDLL
jgi:hypothetical protein